MTTLELLKAWTFTDFDVDEEAILADFLPDPHADNWVEDQILKAQRGVPGLTLMPVFGRAFLTSFSMGHGEFILWQKRDGERRQVSWFHEEPWTFSAGGCATIHPPDARGFITDWYGQSEELEGIAYEASEKELVGVEALASIENDESRAMVERFVSEFKALATVAKVLPSAFGSSALNAALDRFVDRDRAPEAILRTINRSGWIVGNLVGHVNLPSGEAIDSWRRGITETLADGGPDPELLLFRLWGAFLADIDTAAMVELCKDHAWRAIRDSARLIERLMVDPTIGRVTLVTASTLKARQDAERRAAEEAERQHQAFLDAGNIFLEPTPAKPPTIQLALVAAKDVPESFKNRFSYTGSTSFDLTKDIAPREWLGTTESGAWIGVSGVANPKGSGNKHYSLVAGKAGEEPAAFEPPLVWNGYAANPSAFEFHGDYAYTIHEHDLVELSLLDRSWRSLIAHNDGVGVFPESKVVWGFTVAGDSLWTLDHDGDGKYLRRCSLKAGGALELIAVAEVFAASVDYHAETNTLVVFTMAHGLWFIDATSGRVFFRVDEAASTTLAYRLPLFRVDGVVFFTNRNTYKIINIEHPDRSAGVVWTELAANIDRLDEVPTRVRDK